MKQIYKDIVSFQNRCNDYIDDHASAVARSLKNEVQKLEDEVQVGKNPRSLESRLKSVIHHLEQTGKAGAMSIQHVNELVNRCENFQHQLRSM